MKLFRWRLAIPDIAKFAVGSLDVVFGSEVFDDHLAEMLP